MLPEAAPRIPPAPAASAAAGWQRWAWVAAAAIFINTSYGTMSYAFSILVTKEAAGGTFGPGAVALGFSLALVVAGLAGLPIGTLCDLFGTRMVLAVGAVTGTAGLLLLSVCHEQWQFFLVMMFVLGPAMAATFYEPVYVLMNRWFTPEERGRAYGLLTALSGVSITIFIPLTRLLVHAYGWREAVVILAVILFAVGTLVPLVIRDPGLRIHPATSGRARYLAGVRSGFGAINPGFLVFSATMFVATLAFSGFSFHMVSQLETRGFEAGAVSVAIAVTGFVSLPGRLFLPALSDRVAAGPLLALCLALLAGAALIAAFADEWWQVWVYVGVFGLVFGAVYPLRALASTKWAADSHFGRLIGFQALFVNAGRALGPAAIAAIGTSRAQYEAGFALSGIVLFVSAFAVWRTSRR